MASAKEQSDNWELFTEGDDYYEALLDDIFSARHSIELEVYIFESDEIGRQFVNALCRQARAGVAVRLLIDGLGSLSFENDERDKLISAGVEFKVFRPIRLKSIITPRHWRRNHRKLAVIDERICYTGGINISRVNSKIYYGNLRWRDTMIRVEGALAREALASFNNIWDYSSRKIGFLRGRLLGRKKAGNGEFTLIERIGMRSRRYNRRRIIRALHQAQHSVQIETAYFVPPVYMVRQLKKLARRRIKVTLLVSSSSDVKIVLWASRAFFGTLLKSGVRIFEYPTRFLHAKMTIIDSELAVVGSSNIDYRSDLHNLELDLVARNRKLSQRVVEIFNDDLSQATELNYSTWKKRPLSQKLIEKFCYLFRYLL